MGCGATIASEHYLYITTRAIAHGDTAALVDAIRTGKARLGTKVQHAARSGRGQGSDTA
jgi:hypothetical protein